MATNGNVLGKVYETLLCSPGMNEQVRIDVKMDRKAALLLQRVIESGLEATVGETAELFKLLPGDTLDDLRAFGEECLKKAGLLELSEKLKALN